MFNIFNIFKKKKPIQITSILTPYRVGNCAGCPSTTCTPDKPKVLEVPTPQHFATKAEALASLATIAPSIFADSKRLDVLTSILTESKLNVDTPSWFATKAEALENLALLDNPESYTVAQNRENGKAAKGWVLKKRK